MKLWSRGYKNINDVMRLTSLSAKLAVADMVDVTVANKAVESVINQYGRQGDAVSFATHVVDAWTNVAHNAQSSAQDLAEALMRSGAAAHAVGVDFDTTTALASTMIKTTGLEGANIGNALKSLFSSIHSDKAITDLTNLGIEVYKFDADGTKHFRDVSQVLMDLMLTSHETSQNMAKDLQDISGGKFQWSKISALLGDYKDFIKAYDLSIQSTGFSEGQIAAQMDTLTKKFEQFKATLTGLLTQGGSAGFTGFLKEMLGGITHAIKGLESIPKSTFETIGSMAKWGVIALGVAKAFSFLNTSITAIRVALKGEVVEEAADTVAKGAETAATEGLTVATTGLSRAVTVASAGLNLVIAAIATAVVGYGMYSASVGEAAAEQDAANEKAQEAIDVKRQEIEMNGKQVEQIGTLGAAYIRLTQRLEEVKGNEEEENKTKQDLEATETELTKLIGEDGVKRIKTSDDIAKAIKDEQDAHAKKTESIIEDIKQLQTNQLQYTDNQIYLISERIKWLQNEGSVWQKLQNMVVHAVGEMQKAQGEWQVSVATNPFTGKTDQYLLDKGQYNIAQGENNIAWDSRKQEEDELQGQLNEWQIKRDQLELDISKGAYTPPQTTSTGGDEVPDAVKKTKKGKTPPDNSLEAKTWRLLNKTFSEAGTAGIMGRFEVEAPAYDDDGNIIGIDPNAYNPSDGGSYGFAQWTGDSGRYQQLVDASGGIEEAKNPAMQLAFMIQDMQNNYPDLFAQLKEATDPEAAADLFTKYYEIPADPDNPNQRSYADYWYSKYSKEGENKTENFQDILKERKEAYENAYKNYEEEVASNKNEFAKSGKLWTANDSLYLLETMVKPFSKGITEYANKEAQLQQEVVKEKKKNQLDEQEAVKKHIGVVEQMSDVEEQFLKKHHAVTNREDINYRIGENEKSWSSQAGWLQSNLTNTASSPQAQEQMLSAWNEFENAKTEADAKAAYAEMMNLSKNTDATKAALKKLESAYTEYAKKREDLEYEYEENARRYQMVLMDSFKSGIENGFYDILTRTKSFAEAMRDIFKNLWNSLARQLSSDLSQRIAKAFTQVTKGTSGTNTESDNPLLTMIFGTSGMNGINSAISQITSKVNTLGNVIKSGSTSSGSVVESNIGNILSSFTTTSSTVQSGVKATSQAAISGSSTATTSILSNLKTISWQMIAIMVVMEVLSKLLGSGKSTKTSTSSVSLGRNPGTYYVTPSTVSQIPSYDVGTLNVPEDTLAMVHKGESIFPASVAENIRKSGGVSGGSAMTVSSTFSPNLIDSRGIKDVYHESTQDLAKEMKSIYRRFAGTSLA